MAGKRQFALLLAAALASSGCGGGETAGPEGGEEQVTVRFWHAMGGPLGDVLDGLVEEFNRAHPSWRVQAESMGSYEALKQKLLASIIARNQPDMSQAYEAWISTLLGGEALVDLEELDPGFKNTELKDFYPVLIDNSLYQGRLYSLPFNKSVPVIYYNRDMFRRAGLDPEKPPRTWEEFAEYSKKLTRDLDGDGRPDQWGHKFTDHATYFECLLVQNGGRILDPETGEMDFNSPAGAEALQFLVDLVHRDGAADFYLGGYQHQVDFAAQDTAMIVASCVSRTFMAKQLNFDWAMAPLLERDRPASLVYGTNIVIFSRSSPEKQKVCWEFAKWFTSPEITARWAILTNYVPVRRSALGLPLMQEAIRENPSTAVPIMALEDGFFEPRLTQWLQVRDYLDDAVKEALLQKLTPQQALDKAIAKGRLWF